MVKELLDSDSSETELGDLKPDDGPDFNINEDFARKFTHNKKREEIRRLEEKLGSTYRKRKRLSEDDDGSTNSDASTSSDSEDEDDAGELATEARDAEIMATLNAIRSRDPRVYDEKSTFYAESDDGADGSSRRPRGVKPMYLQDYHRENLLNNINGGIAHEAKPPLTYNQEQEALKRFIVGEINAAAAAENPSSDDTKGSDEDGTFLVTKERDSRGSTKRNVSLDIENADKDPETFLSNFMASRAWVPSDQAALQPVESDDEEEERRAEEFEEAYNFRFEDPAKSNEKLVSHARDVTAKYSVRREDTNPRKKRRDAERAKKEVAKLELAEQKARLRKLKIEEVEEKSRRIKRAAGLKGTDLDRHTWVKFLDDSWDDAKWEQEMQRRFGDAYYAEDDAESGIENADASTSTKRKPKKPTWDDEIDIKDIIPDFVEDEQANFSLSDQEVMEDEEDPEGKNGSAKLQKTSKDYRKERQEKKKESRKEQRIIEQLVEDKVQLDTALMSAGPRMGRTFRYRETSPLSYGLSARDILMAGDSQLNEFAGLKKLAAFRDPEKKRKDQKHLGKKARLRKWRKETFGDENGPTEFTLPSQAQDTDTNGVDKHEPAAGEVDFRTEGKRRKRRRSTKNKLGGNELA